MLKNKLITCIFLGIAAFGCSNSEDGRPPGNQPNPVPEPGACVGPTDVGRTCSVSTDCSTSSVCLNNVCVYPNDPSVTCRPGHNEDCDGGAFEGAQCSPGGFCVVLPNTCATNSECPTGFACEDILEGNGSCEPSNESVCDDKGSGPFLHGIWKVNNTLHLRAGISDGIGNFLDVTEVINDFAQGTVNFDNIPSWVEAAINSFAPAIIDEITPPWLTDIVAGISNVSDILDDMKVKMTWDLDGRSCKGNYRGTATWDTLTFQYNGTTVTRAPSDFPEIGEIVSEEFQANYACGFLYIDRHRVYNELSKLPTALINEIVRDRTQYDNWQEALVGAIDCARIGDQVNNQWEETGSNVDIDGIIEAACVELRTQGIEAIADQLAALEAKLNVITLQGSAEAKTDRQLTNGHWYGSLVGSDFPGEFAGARQ